LIWVFWSPFQEEANGDKQGNFKLIKTRTSPLILTKINNADENSRIEKIEMKQENIGIF